MLFQGLDLVEVDLDLLGMLPSDVAEDRLGGWGFALSRDVFWVLVVVWFVGR